jgi:hypothetical protein
MKKSFRELFPATKTVKCSKCGMKRKTSSKAAFCRLDHNPSIVTMVGFDQGWICCGGYGCSKKETKNGDVDNIG